MSQPVVREVDVVGLAAALRDDPLVIDVREPFEYNAGHLEGAKSMPMHLVPKSMGELPKDDTLFVICRSGNRSWQVCQYLNQHGYDAVNVAGGMVAWDAAGLTVSGGTR
jgi:rhodanese-related sulfurtransferase